MAENLVTKLVFSYHNQQEPLLQSLDSSTLFFPFFFKLDPLESSVSGKQTSDSLHFTNVCLVRGKNILQVLVVPVSEIFGKNLASLQ